MTLTWELVIMMAFLMLVLGGVIAGVIVVIGAVKEKNTRRLIQSMTFAIEEHLLPAYTEKSKESFEEIMDVMVEKLPKVMDSVAKSTKKLLTYAEDD